jgi:hypothetical protein
VLVFIARPAQTVSPIKFIKVQITNKSSKEIHQPKPMPIVKKKIKIYSSASIEANPIAGICSKFALYDFPINKVLHNQ